MTQRQAQRQTVNVKIVNERKKKRRSTRKRAPVRRPQISFPPPVIQVVQERYFPGVPPNPPPQAPYQPPVTPKVATSTAAFGTQTAQDGVFDEMTREDMRAIRQAIFDAQETKPIGTQTVEPAFFVPLERPPKVSGTGTQVNFDQDTEMHTMKRRPTLSDFSTLGVNINPVQSSDFGIQTVADTFTPSSQTDSKSFNGMTSQTDVKSFSDMTSQTDKKPIAQMNLEELKVEMRMIGIIPPPNMTKPQAIRIFTSEDPQATRARIVRGKDIDSEMIDAGITGKRKPPYSKATKGGRPTKLTRVNLIAE